MVKRKKFNAFSGVFTPSILTILGVIMYLRLGWVVGQAGLIAALGIILLSHIISVTTGLSISSIATDKRIKIGGIYYILSRSLGLPMGGAIGFALFAGTALSISLYIVGFVENFLSIEVISTFIGMEMSPMSIRIIGTIVIIFLVLIAFISTSLAIKTQFFILVAIGLSLISIVVGFYILPDFSPKNIILAPFEKGEDLAYVFSIFFPAVTGFTAGVAMSGDLEDPKKNIPVGTLTAIAVGFVVYMGLAVGLAMFVKRDMLVDDSSFIMKIAWLSPLVIAGIWGATLSSALGGILGAPRIMQAIAKDKIAPRFLGKGYGLNNEPRNALLLTFGIAELGILIGELNAIASVVSMFYLASYGFINLAYSLESWASSDFRPSFRIPKFIGIIGFIACFGIMFKLDAISMFIALVIMGGIYFFLKKREIKSDYGDVWQSVWASVIRNALHRMDKSKMAERNWQPNVILFSGGTKRRPHLISFGKFLVGKYGILSNFDLVESKSAKVLFPKHQQSLPEVDANQRGVFTRRQSCRDIYEGIETIAATYGFSGVEPNTVLMGWARQSDDPVRFVKMLNTLNELDMNVLLLDYDKRYGFGKYRLIDIWWRGAGNNGNLALNLAKFIFTSPEWNESKIRLLVVNSENEDPNQMRKSAEKIFESLRLNAEIKIINNQIEQKSFYDIIRVESIHSDLIFLGIPPQIDAGREEEFVDKTSRLMKDIGSVVLIRASSQFKKINFATGIELTKIKKKKYDATRVLVEDVPQVDEIAYPKNNNIALKIKDLHTKLLGLNEIYYKNYLLSITKHHNNLNHTLDEIINKSFHNISEKVCHNEPESQRKLMAKIQNNFILRSRKAIEEFQNQILEKQSDELQNGVDYFVNDLDLMLSDIQKYLAENYTLEDLKRNSEDEKKIRRFKFWQRIIIRIIGHPVEYKNKYRKIVAARLPEQMYRSLFKQLEKWGLLNINHIVEIRKTLKLINNNLLLIENKIDKQVITPEEIMAEKSKFNKKIEELDELVNKAVYTSYKTLIARTTNTIQEISDIIKQLNANQIVKKKQSPKKEVKRLQLKVQNAPSIWYDNQQLLFNICRLELLLISFENKLRKIFVETTREIKRTFEKTVLKNLNNLNNYLISYQEALRDNPDTKFEIDKSWLQFDKDNYYLFFKEIIDITFQNLKTAIGRFPESIEIITDSSINNFKKLQYEQIETIQVAASRLLDYIVQNELIEPLQKIIDELPVKLLQINSVSHDVVRLISFNVEQVDENDFRSFSSINDTTKLPDTSPEAIISFIGEQQQKIEAEIDKTEEYRDYIVMQIRNRLNTMSNRLSMYSFSKTAVNLRQYIQQQESKRRFSALREKGDKISMFFSNLIDKLWYRQSKAILYAKSVNTTNYQAGKKVNALLNMIEDVSPSEQVLNNLPFYYQQLFLREHNYYQEFWYGRSKALNEAKTSVRRYKSGYQGGMLITGEHNSGKTFFSRYIASTMIDDAYIYHIKPVISGSVDVRQFKKAIEQSVGLQGSYDEIFNQLPINSVMLIDDAELWWQKSENGCCVIKKIMELIEKYSHECLFIINMNKHSFKIINRIVKIEYYFLNIIDCSPFDAEELKEIIITRHRSSGMKFIYKKRHQDDFRNIDFATVFTRLFNYSRGNVGIALLGWIANISKCNQNTIYIKAPKAVDTEIFEYLDTNSLVFLVQFVLHKHLTSKRLQEITFEDEKYISQHINFLRRTGLIKENFSGIYELNPYIYPYILEFLQENEMI